MEVKKAQTYEHKNHRLVILHEANVVHHSASELESGETEGRGGGEGLGSHKNHFAVFTGHHSRGLKGEGGSQLSRCSAKYGRCGVEMESSQFSGELRITKLRN